MTHPHLEGLIPCPFCGGSAQAHNYVIEACVRCDACGATIKRTHPPINDDGLPAAIAAWNKRPLAALPGGGVEAVAWRFRYPDSTRWTYQEHAPAPLPTHHGKVVEALIVGPGCVPRSVDLAYAALCEERGQYGEPLAHVDEAIAALERDYPSLTTPTPSPHEADRK